MMDTANCRNGVIFPVQHMKHGGDGKTKPFQVVRCMHQPNCNHVLRLAACHGRLPASLIAKRAVQKGWLCDKGGYALCPDHKPKKTSKLPAHQRRAAFLRLRDDDLAASALRLRDAANLNERSRAMEVEAQMKSKATELIDRASVDPNVHPQAVKSLGLWLAALDTTPRGKFPKQGDVATRGGLNDTTFNNHLGILVKAGYLLRASGRRVLPNYNILTQPIPAKMEKPVTELAAKTTPVTAEDLELGVVPEAPRQPTVEENRRIRRYLDDHYDEAAGKWCGDHSDAKAAADMKLPRAWVTNIRDALYGPDRNEAQERQTEQAKALAADAAKLVQDALTIATRAEELERRAKALFGDA